MSSISWTATSGNWGNAADWSGDAVPTSSDDVTIAVGSSVTVTISANEASNSITTSGSALSVTNGLFTVGSNASFGGAYAQSGGTAMFEGNGAAFAGGIAQSGGLLDITGNNFSSSSALAEAGGTLIIDTSSGGTLSGTTSLSAGTIATRGGILVDTNSFTQSSGYFDVAGSGAVFAGFVNQTGGAMLVQGAALTFQGPSDSIAGTISGSGTLVVNGGITTLDAGAVITVPRILVQQGTLALNNGFSASQVFSVGANGHVSLGGNSLVLSGRALIGGELGGGVTNANGTGRLLNGLVIDNNATLNIGGVFSQSGNIALSSASLNIDAQASLTLTGNDAISNGSALGTLTNAGLLAKTGGGLTADITTAYSGAGSIAIGIGTIDFDGLNNNFAGAISGAGRVSFGASNQVQGTTDTFETGMTLATGAVLIGGNSTSVYMNESKLTYGGAWQENGGTFYLDGSLILNGIAALDGGLVKGAGTLTANGLVNLGGVDFEGDTHTTLTAQVIQSSAIGLGEQSGSAPTLMVAAGATMTLEGAANIYGADGNLVNLGHLTKAGGAADIVEQGTLTSTGTLMILSGTLSSTGAAVLGGVVAGAGVLELAGATTLDNGLSLSVGEVLISEPNGATVTMEGNLTYAGLFAQHGGTLALNAHALTLNGGLFLDGGTLAGSGLLREGIAATVANYTVSGQANLDLVKGGDQSGTVVIQADSQMDIGPHGTYLLDDNQSIVGGNSGTGTLLVDGALKATGLGLSTLGVSVVDNGSISAGSGQMSFLSSVTGTGVITASAGGQIDLGAAVSSSIGINIAAGDISLVDGGGSAFAGTITGFSAGDFIEITGLQSGVIGNSWNAGDTQLTLSDASGDSFTLNFASAVNTASVITGIGPHGYIGVYHS
jgi:fibronectin-binding autotransporter adhesin